MGQLDPVSSGEPSETPADAIRACATYQGRNGSPPALSWWAHMRRGSGPGLDEDYHLTLQMPDSRLPSAKR